MNIFLSGEPEIVQIYWKAEQKCRKYLNRFVYFMILNQLLFVATFIYSIFCILIRRVDVWTFMLSFHMVVPFDTQTNWGWYLLWSIQFCMSFSYALTMVSITSYFISCCTYIEALCKHFKSIADSADEIDANGKDNNPNGNRQYHAQIKEKFSQAVEIHVKMFE